MDALCECLEKDQLQVAFGGSYEGDGVIVPGRPLEVGLNLLLHFQVGFGITIKIMSTIGVGAAT